MEKELTFWRGADEERAIPIIAEALATVQSETREACAKVVEADISEYCAECVRPSGEKVFCESYACHSLRDIAAAIRALATPPGA